MKRLREWIRQTFLPVWAKEDLLKENRSLKEKNQELQNENARLKAYIDGLEAGIRAQRRIIINNGGRGK